MTNINEAAQGSLNPMASALQTGVDTISLNQLVNFELYVRVVLPLDGYVFWVRQAAISTAPSALFNVMGYNTSQLNQPTNTEPPVPAASFQAKGSFHYITDAQQDEASSSSRDRVVFTSEDPVQNLNAVDPQFLYIGTFADEDQSAVPADATPIRFAFSGRNSHYVQAGLWHYTGIAVYTSMATQIVDDPRLFNQNELIVDNSLPLWLAFNRYYPVWPVPIPRPNITLYPSFLVPANLDPPYGTVHVDPGGTQTLQAMPTLGDRTSQYQLNSDLVTITLYGVKANPAQDFLYSVLQYSLDTEVFGIMNMPVIRDEKETQPELLVIAQKKTIVFEVSYTHGAVRNLARQLIESVTVEIHPSPDVQFPQSAVA